VAVFDLKSLFKKEVEKQLTDVEDYIFMPERIQLKVDDGQLNCVLNSDGSVNIFYTKQGVTDVRVATRKHPLTSFEAELQHGLYDDVIEDVVDMVNKTVDGKSKYFRSAVILPATPSLQAPEPTQTKTFD